MEKSTEVLSPRGRVSVVIPAYNEEKRIRGTLDRLAEYFSQMAIDYELVVVDDGSLDRTGQEVAESGVESVRLLRLERNQGKGEALRKGVQYATGDVIFFSDADLPYDTVFFEQALRLLRGGRSEAVIGARDLPDSQSDPSYPPFRVWMGKVFSNIVNALLPIRIFDTQCGFKGFRAARLKKAVAYTRRRDYTLDIELLLLYRLCELPIERLPVRLVRHHGSQIRTFRDSARMLRSLGAICSAYFRGHYPRRLALENLESVDCPVCGTSKSRIIGLKAGRFRFCSCRSCTTLYQNPRIARDELEQQYGPQYFRSSSVESGYPDYESSSELRRKTAEWIWDQLESQGQGPSRRVLDVGCASGEFLMEGLKRGMECWGNDVARLSRNLPYQFVEGDFLEAELPQGYFDWLIFNDSFEHFAEPQSVLERCRLLLSEGGRVLINTPDPDSWLAIISGRKWNSFKHEHLVIYPRQVLSDLLTRHGFQVQRRIASRQYVDWNYLKTRLNGLPWPLAWLMKAPLARWVGRRRMLPTGGMIVIARIDSRTLKLDADRSRPAGAERPQPELRR